MKATRHRILPPLQQQIIRRARPACLACLRMSLACLRMRLACLRMSLACLRMTLADKVCTPGGCDDANR